MAFRLTVLTPLFRGCLALGGSILATTATSLADVDPQPTTGSANVPGLLEQPNSERQAPLTAETDAHDNPMEETVVVASRVITRLDELGLSVSVVDQDTLKRLGYVSAGRVLDLQPGVSVSQDGGLGKTATVRIRGEEGFRTRVLLDGISVADPSSPQVSPRLEHLLSDGLQRMEILRGPQGLLYGADAGGVIAISSAQPTTGFSATFNAEAGSNAMRRSALTLSGGSEKLKAAISLADVETDGFNARASDTNPADDDGYSNTTLHGHLELSASEHWDLGLTVHTVEGDNEYDGCFDALTFALINRCDDSFEQQALRGFARWQNERLSSELSVEENRIERAYSSAGIETFGTEGKQQTVSWLNNLVLFESSRVTAGLDAQEQSLVDGSNDRARDNLGVFVEYAQNLQSTSLALGARLDDNEDFGQHTSWRASLAQPFTLGSINLNARAAMGTGFRAPSLYEIAYNRGPWAYGAAIEQPLREERSRGWEMGLDVASEIGAMGITWFEQHIEREIYFDLAAYSGYLQREGQSVSRGMELTGQLTLPGAWRLEANATWNETQDHLGNTRPYRPEFTAASTLSWRAERIETALVARTARNAVDTQGDPMEDYTVLDASLQFAITPTLQLTARLENATDRDYQQVRDFLSAGRQWFLGLRYTL